MLGEGWIPDHVLDAEQVVLFVVDGLGWNQLVERQALAPVLAASVGQPITTVAPTTTAAALTSIATGAPPGEHGVVGYRIRTGGETLNALRWSTENGDARERVLPDEMQALTPFGGRNPVVITKAEFETSGFTRAHLSATRFRGYSTVATMVHEISKAIAEGERFVYAYYDGLDRVGHERGHNDAFDAEFAFVDRLVGEIRDVLPPAVALAVTADHGQIHTGDQIVPIHESVMRHVVGVSGEARFVWLHAIPGNESSLLEAAQAAHHDNAWVLSVDEVLTKGLLGAQVTPAARARLGDVAMIVHSKVALVDPAAPPSILIGRHGSLTADEMYVPLLCPQK
jgi:predicted AlkP superfamily pyrophosphatase or phosphodiesterase